MATASPLPPGYSPPLAIVSANDKSGAIIIVNIICLTLVVLSTLVRIRIRFSPKAAKPAGVFPANASGRDDVACFVATVLCIIQSSLILYAVSRGLGKSIDLIGLHRRLDIQKSIYASDVFFILGLYFSKCSVILLYMRINHPKPARHFKVGLVVCTVWMVLSIFLATLKCNLTHPWLQYDTRCNPFAHWAVIEITSLLTEVMLFVLAIWLVSSLDMTSSHKLHVVSLFGSRLPVLAFAILHLDLFPSSVSSNPTLRAVPALIWAQLEFDYSVAAVTIPCGMRFIAQFDTRYGRLDQCTITTVESHNADRSEEHSQNITPASSIRQPPPRTPTPPPEPQPMIRGEIRTYNRNKRRQPRSNPIRSTSDGNVMELSDTTAPTAASP